MSDRKAGWYWVKVFKGGKWGCFNWNGHAWRDSAGEYQEEIFDVVGSRIPEPDEPWQCVPVEATPDMMEASGYGASVETKEAWFEMLAAAPKPGGL